MTEQDAITTLAAMVEAATSPTLSDDDLRTALAAAVIPDKTGSRPGDTGWTPTWDLEWAAAETADLRALRATQSPMPTVTKFSSEGSTFDLTTGRTDWAAVAHMWRSRSQLGQQLGYGTQLGVIDIPAATPYVPTSERLSW